MPTFLVNSEQLIYSGSQIGEIQSFWFCHPFPTDRELKALGEVVGVDAERLRKMLPPRGEGMMFEPIRLCAACYVDSACHKIEFKHLNPC